MVEEPKGELLGIFTPKLSDEISKAEAVAQCAIQKLESMGVDLSNLSALGGDSTVSNTGYKGGAFTLIEKKLGRRLNWIVCCQALCPFLCLCVCVSKSLRKWTQTDTKVTYHPPPTHQETFFGLK